jgi:hypothetical protein
MVILLVKMKKMRKVEKEKIGRKVMKKKNYDKF